MANTTTTGTQHAAVNEANGALQAEVAGLIVSALNLDIEAGEINADDPLYGEGLGLDSIDILELALAISQTYGVQLRSDDENNTTIFQSLRSLTNDIQQRRLR